MTEEHRINIMDEQPSAAIADEKKPADKVEYASIIERFVALVIDYGVVLVPLMLLARFVLNQMPVETAVDSLIPAAVIINICFIVYETIFSCADRVTIGKWLVGIAVMKKDGSGPISWGRSFLRAIGYYLSAILFGCGFLWAIIDDRHRSWHDVLGGSVVVRVRPKSTFEKWFLQIVGGILLFLLGYVVYNNVWGGSSWQEKMKVKQAKEFVDKFGYLEEVHRNLYGDYTTDYLRLVLLSGDPVQFQRDMNKVIDNKGFRIGVKDGKYKIMARAKDEKNTVVICEKGK